MSESQWYKPVNLSKEEQEMAVILTPLQKQGIQQRINELMDELADLVITKGQEQELLLGFAKLQARVKELKLLITFSEETEERLNNQES